MITSLFLLMILQGTSSLTPCTSSFCPPVLDSAPLTLDNEIPSKFLGQDPETGCRCLELKEVYSLCYNTNDRAEPCVRFPKTIKISTKALLVKATYITKISYGDFQHLSHLEKITFEANQQLASIEPFSFANLGNLTSLGFVFNPLLSTLHPDTFQGLVSLKELNLLKNGFRSIRVFSASLKPSILPRLKNLNLNENIFRNISKDDFGDMRGTSIEELSLVLCGIENIHRRSLKPFKNLSVLRIGSNRIEPQTLAGLLEETIRFGIDLMELNLFSSGFRGFLPRSLLEVIAGSNITSLILERNQFDNIDNETFPVLMKNLNLLDLTDVSAQSVTHQAFAKLPNLKTLILASNKLSFFPASKYLPKLTFLDLKRNTDAYGWEFFLTRSEFHKMKLQYLDLEFTRLLLLTKTDFGFMPHLRILNLKNCSVIKVENGTFKSLTNLRILNLENNQFFKWWILEHFNLFEGLHRLEVLLLGGNGIGAITIPGYHLLKYLRDITHLRLNKNNLQTISKEDFAHLKKLQILDVSDNFIVSWDDRVFFNRNFQNLQIKGNKISYLSDAMLEDFRNLTSIEISYNSFICDCRMKKMSHNEQGLIRFLKLIKNIVYCLQPTNRTLNDFITSIITSTLICDSGKINSLIFIIPSVIIFVIVSILAILGYYYRWHIRYWAFLVRLYLTRKGRIRNSGLRGYTHYQFDAFVSYCNQDRNFVVRLVRMLENHEPYLKLCVYERDFQVGSVISESVLEHITKSRKTLLIVSNAYAKSYWCNWETQIAEHHRLFFENPNGDYVDDSIVLIKLGSIIEAHLNPTLKYLLKTRIYLEWDSDDLKQKVFWNKLRQFLSPPAVEILENTHL